MQSNFRVTEQGDIMHQNFDYPACSKHNLDIYTLVIFYKHNNPRKILTKEFWDLISDLLWKYYDICCKFLQYNSQFVL